MTLPLLYIPSVPSPLWILLILCFSPLATFAAIEKNVTVDDTDSSILYTGTFHLGSPTNLDYGGNHMLSEDIGATAKFTFTGTAVYMLSPKWPYGVDTAVSIDGGPSTTVDLVDHAAPQTTGGSESFAYSVVWSKTGLTNTSHTVQLSRANNYVIVDGFIFTQSLSDSAASPSSSTGTGSASGSKSGSATATTANSSSTSAAGATTSGGSSKTVPIAVGTVFGVLGLAALLGIFLLWKRRQPKERGNVPDASTWDKSAFAPQFANGGSPPTSGYYAPAVASYTAPTPTSATGLTSSYHNDYASPQTSEFGVAPYSSVALGVGSTSSHSDYGRSTASHPYSFANAPAKTRESGSAYYNPYAEQNASSSAPPVPPLVWNATTSQTSLLRSSKTDTDTRQVSYASEGDAAESSNSHPISAAGVSQQPRYMSSQEEKAELYRRQHPTASGPSGPRPPNYTDS